MYKTFSKGANYHCFIWTEVQLSKISQTGWAPGSVGSDEQHLPQNKNKHTGQTKSFLSSPPIFSLLKKWSRSPSPPCPWRDFFYPHMVKYDDTQQFSFPGASVARRGKTTRRHYTKFNLIKLYSIFFFFIGFLCFFLIVEVIERETKSSLGPSCSFMKVFTH